MKGEIHGINCLCCKEKSPEATAILNEINKILESLGPSNIANPKEAVIKRVEEYQKILAPAGDLAPLVNLTKEVFSLPSGDLVFEELELKDKNKKVGAFKVADISDHPHIDVTKLIDFSKIDLTKFTSLKISLVIPTIEATMGLKFGPIRLGITFKIGLDTFAWYPEVKFKNAKDAIKNLAGLTYQKILTESGGASLGKLKGLAKKQFLKTPAVLQMLEATQSPKDFFAALNNLGLNIIEDVDIAAEAQAFHDNAEGMQSLLNKAILPEPGKTTAADIGNIDLCPEKPAESSPYTMEEIVKVHDEVCEPPALEAVAVPVLDIPNVELPSQEGEIKKVKDFLSDIKSSANAMQSCAKAKSEAAAKWYFLFENKILHQYTQLYFQSLLDAIESFYGNTVSMLKKRDALVNELAISINKDKPLYNSIDEYQESPDKFLKSLLSSSNSIIGYTVSDTISQLAIQYAGSKNAAIINELKVVQTQYNQYKDQLKSFANLTLSQMRAPLGVDANPISNLVGYENGGNVLVQNWVIKANPAVAPRLKKLWEDSKNSEGTKDQGFISGVNSPLTNYIYNLDLPQYKDGNIVKNRTGVLETQIWKPFYSADRYDYFFTYEEQGYNQPKPMFGINGKAVGPITKKKIKDSRGRETIIEIPDSANGLEVDSEKAQAFWETSEDRLRTRIQERVNLIIEGSESKKYISDLLYVVAKREAAAVFYKGLENRSFIDGANGIYGISHVQDFRRKSYVVDVFKQKLNEELDAIQKEIEAHQACVEANQNDIVKKSLALAKTKGLNSTNLAEECKRLLGSDPVGQKPSGGRCPGYSKDCYWKEYTKLMQKVSLMPIPELDPQNLATRLFRYYPVAIQIPVPTPIPAVLPTLAMGIPDPLISIPLPLIWKHIVTIPTPLGIMVIWIAFAGPVPSPFIMLLDEKEEATFMLTSRGPCSIPHTTVGGTNPLEKKSLLDLILPPETIKIDMSSPIGKLLMGSAKNDASDPDSAKNVIDKLKERIKSSFSQLEISDYSPTAGLTEAAAANRKSIKEAFEKIPPDTKTIQDALEGILKKVEKSIDKINITNIKIPKNDKKLITPTLGPMEIIDQLTAAIGTAASAPSNIAKQALQDLGMGIKTIDLTKKLKERILNQLSKKSIKKFLADIDLEIDNIENKLSFKPDVTEAEKTKERIKIIKKLVKKPIQEAADEIDPELLGFVAKALDLPVLPFPCYTNVSFEPVPPYVYAIIAAVKAAPGMIDALSDDQIMSLVSFELDLSKQLPSADKLFYKTINGLLDSIPNIVVPDSVSDNMFKETTDMVKQIPFKFKVRLPKAGLPTQIVIPGELVKSIMKQAARTGLNALSNILLAKLNEAVRESKAEKIIGVALIIKGLFGASLEEIKGSDIKAFLNSLLESFVYPALDAVSSIITAANALKSEYLSVIELFQFPPKPSLAGKDGPFYEVGTEQLKALVDPLIQSVLPIIFANLPYPVTLLGCSSTASRLAFTKLHPTKPFERTPAWESLSLKNIPFVVWLDYLIATAQRKSGLGSTYLLSSGAYQAIP